MRDHERQDLERQSLDLQNLISKDFLALKAKFDGDDFADRLSAKLHEGDKVRFAIVGAAGISGGVIAGAQFAELAALLEKFLPAITIVGGQGGGVLAPPQLLAAALAILAVATAAIWLGER